MGGKSFPGVVKSKNERHQQEKAAREEEEDEDEEDEEEGDEEEGVDTEGEEAGNEAGQKTSSTFRNVERNFEGPTVVFTNSSEGTALPGIRFVLVKEATILHKNYSLEEAPHSMDLKSLP